MAQLPSFLVVGGAGDGKSSIIKKLLAPGEEQPDTGRGTRGVTKEVSEYNILCFDEPMLMTDTMGVGDMDKGIVNLIASLRAELENSHRQVDGIVVTNLTSTGRMGVDCQILKQIIEHGMVKNSDGISPWERIIVCGTQRDRCDNEEIEYFMRSTGPAFFEGKAVPKEWQVTTCSTKNDSGMTDLMQSMANMIAAGRYAAKWDPVFDAGGQSVQGDWWRSRSYAIANEHAVCFPRSGQNGIWRRCYNTGGCYSSK
jgi:hypothetical protein